MQILTSSAQLQRLEGILKKSLPLTLPVYGAVLNITRGNPGHFEVLVDKWPDFGAVLARPRGEVAHGDMGRCRERGGMTRCPGMCQVCSGHLWVPPDPLHPIPHRHPPSPLLTHSSPRPDPSVRVGSLLPSHVDLLNETWPYGGNARSRRYLAELLGRFPHVCLQDSAGEPLSWVLTDHFGTGTHSFTLPAHRRRGHMQVALTVAAQRAQARGFPSFG
ncbi:GLYL3 protein, partial [Onychorhynchus coronatus]|nr:GLYL3 protein [Onychorhynchus coronatus]